MTRPESGAARAQLSGPIAQLVDHWQRAGLAAGWPSDEPWWLPPVDTVASCLVDLGDLGQPANDLAAACTALGAARAGAGFDLAQTRTDLLAVLGIAAVDELTSLAALDSVTLGWIDATLDQRTAAGSIDPLTQLASTDYLQARIGELYAAASKSGTTAAITHELLVVRLRPTADPMLREMRMVLVERALRSVFDGGETLARLAPNAVVALVDAAPQLHEPRIRDSLAALDEWLTASHALTQLRWVALPTIASELPGMLRRVAG